MMTATRTSRKVLAASLVVLASCSAQQQTSDTTASESNRADAPTIAATSAPHTSRTDATTSSTSPDPVVSSTTISTITTTSTTTTTMPILECGELASGASSLQHGPRSREFTAWVPDNLTVAAPILILLHGFNGDATVIATRTGLDEMAPAAGVILIAPQGIGEPSSWRFGAQGDGLGSYDDIGYIDTLLEHLDESPCIDPDKIWLSGFSAGSAFTGVYGCQRTERLVGLTMVSGLAPPICPEDDGITIQISHGTADAIVPFDGGAQAVGEGAVELDSVPQSSAGWAARAGCAATPTTSQFGDVAINSSSVSVWAGCAGGATVSLLAVDGLNHVWPASGIVSISPIVDAGCVTLHALTESAGDAFATCFG